MPCRKKPTYKTKKQASVHGAITYGSGKHQERRVKGGWRTYKKKR